MSENLQSDELKTPQKDKHNFKKGQKLKFIRVRFPGHIKSYPFVYGQKDIMYGQKVVAMSDRGMTVGYVNSFPYEVEFQESMLPIKSISKIATEKDIEEQVQNYQKEREAEITCKRVINKLKLDMNLTHVEFTQFGKKCVFYFTAPARVDFRELVKNLVGELKIRIELRQIAVRDRAAAVGGIGSCGRQLCCSSFLSKYGNVNLKMAKAQDLSINFDKLNGVCGQIKCCIKYEEEVYSHKKQGLPKNGELVTCKNGDQGKVRNILILEEQFEMITTQGIKRRYSIDQIKERNAKFKMPALDSFDHIANDTSSVKGLDEYNQRLISEREEEIKKIQESEKGYADTVFQELFDTTSIKDEFEPKS